MRIKGHLRLIALVALPAVAVPGAATAQFKIEPYISKIYPRAPSDDSLDRTQRERAGRVPANHGEPPPFGPDRIQCADTSDLCAWKRIPGEGPEFEFTPR